MGPGVDRHFAHIQLPDTLVVGGHHCLQSAPKHLLQTVPVALDGHHPSVEHQFPVLGAEAEAQEEGDGVVVGRHPLVQHFLQFLIF